MAKPGKKHQNFAKQRKQKTKEKRDQSMSQAKPTPVQLDTSPCPAPKQANPVTKQNQEQKRAAFALKRVKELLDGYESYSCGKAQELKAHASALPAMILMNGFGQAAAFYFSKGDVHCRLYAILSDWLTESDNPYAGKDNLLAGITEHDLSHYLLAQAEAQALLEWVKKFANALVEKPSES